MLLNVLLVNLKGIGLRPFYGWDCGFESLFRKYTPYEEFMNRNRTQCAFIPPSCKSRITLLVDSGV